MTQRPRFFAGTALSVAAAVAVLVLALSGRYGYHRDELYFRLLGADPAWGYVDQPPLTPLVARASTVLFGDTPTGLRVPATLAVTAFVVLVALLTRELGGGRGAQLLAAVGAGTSSFALISAHTLVTSTLDLPFWMAAILFAVRAVRGNPRWWLACGAVSGLALYNKHLIVLFGLALAVGLLAVGPRRVLREPWLWAGAGLTLLLGAPNLAYQVTHGWPQLAMADAIARTDGTANRIGFVPLQLVLLGPPLVPIWVAGWIRLWRDRTLRAFAVAYPVAAVLTVVSAGQGYYVVGLLALLFAAGCVAVRDWLADRPGRLAVVAGAVGVNAAVSAVVALPLVPVGALHATPVPAVNEVARESVGWPELVDQVEAAYAALPDAAGTVLLTSNYGEAGALDRYGAGLPPVYSGHNELWHHGPPPADARVVLAVGVPPQRLAGLFQRCETVGRIDNGHDVDNEEQGASIVACRNPVAEWSVLWPRLQHFS